MPNHSRGNAPRDTVMRKVAVIGSGIAGLAAARELSAHAHVVLYEAATYFGGHAHTVDVTLPGSSGPVTHGVDTGFLVFNERTYPHLIRLFGELHIPTALSKMSFSVQAPDGNNGLEWSGSDLNGLFAQRSNVLRPRFWRMLADLVRFNRLTTALANGADASLPRQSIEDFLDQHKFSAAFRNWYLLPMIGCIWSCPTEQMLRFPIATLIRFCHNHGLLQIANRPRWFTVRGGSRCYVEKIVAGLADARLNTPVLSVRRNATAGLNDTSQESSCSTIEVVTAGGSDCFDDVILACHSDQSLALLDTPTALERQVLGAVRYQHNRAVLHTDAGLLPRSRRAWAAWNYERPALADNQSAVCLHYLINELQPLPFEQPVIVSLNPVRQPQKASVLGEFDYAHPVFDIAAVEAQQRLPDLQGHGGLWYCGAWTRYGFHEDGLISGLAVAAALKTRWAAIDRKQHLQAA